MNNFKISKINKIGNIGHFFHENLFYAIDAYLKNKTIKWIIDINLKEWELKFTLLCIKYLNIEYEYCDLEDHRSNLPYNIIDNENFFIIMNMIQEIIKKEYSDTIFKESYKVLYFRNDATTRKMENYNNELDIYFDEIVYDFSCMSFENQVKLFMKCSHFVTIEGAHLTNVIFMNKKAKLLDISPCDNSWQLMFGTSCCVGSFSNFILDLDSSKFKDNIQYNEKIHNQIEMFVKS
jgi:hypothetical protein